MTVVYEHKKWWSDKASKSNQTRDEEIPSGFRDYNLEWLDNSVLAYKGELCECVRVS